MKNILIVDDEADLRKILSLNFRKKGYGAMSAASAGEAMSLLLENETDLILCDINMSDMDGYEFLTLVRKKPQYKTIPFIFITSLSSKDDRIKAYSLGVDNFISKPFNVSEVTAIVESTLKRAEIGKSYGQKISADKSAERKPDKILILDDDPFLAELLKSSLEQENLRCFYCETAREAISTALEYKPDLIISDYNMPEVDGFEFRKMVLNEPKLKDIPFVFYTSNEEENVALSGFDLNIRDFILKKTSMRLTVVKVKNILASIAEERRSTLVELQKAASEINIEFQPDLPGMIEGYKFEYWHEPFRDVPGGDFIDFIELPDEGRLLVFGDMMGKKWGAWFYTFSFISYIRSTIRVLCLSGVRYTASELLHSVNATIYNDSKISQIFSAISFVLIPPSGKDIQYSGAGDFPLLHYRKSAGDVAEYNSSGILLGAREDGKFSDIFIRVEPGDVLMLFTDGITDSVNREGVTFGLDSLKESFKKHALSGSPLENVKAEFKAYTNGDFADDITLLTITGMAPGNTGVND